MKVELIRILCDDIAIFITKEGAQKFTYIPKDPFLDWLLINEKLDLPIISPDGTEIYSRMTKEEYFSLPEGVNEDIEEFIRHKGYKVNELFDNLDNLLSTQETYSS